MIEHHYHELTHRSGTCRIDEEGHEATDTPGKSLIPGSFSEVGSSDTLQDFDDDADIRFGINEDFLSVRHLSEISETSDAM